jgi:hypothetical protein
MNIIKHPEQRVGVFIDTQNLYHSAKNLYHARANFGNVLKDAVSGRRLIRARAYAVTTESGEEKGFFEALEKVGIEMRLKDLQVFSGGAKKADWDVGMAVDAITAARRPRQRDTSHRRRRFRAARALSPKPRRLPGRSRLIWPLYLGQAQRSDG